MSKKNKSTVDKLAIIENSVHKTLQTKVLMTIANKVQSLGYNHNQTEDILAIVVSEFIEYLYKTRFFEFMTYGKIMYLEDDLIPDEIEALKKIISKFVIVNL